MKKSFDGKSLFFLIFLTPLVINPSGYDIFELPKLVYLIFFITLAFLGILGIFFKNQKITFVWNKWVFLLIGLWTFGLVLSTIYSSAPLTSFWGRYERWQGLFTHLFYLVYFLLALQFFQSMEFQTKALKVIVAVTSVVSGFAILQKFNISIFSGPDVHRFLGRVFGTLGHPNFLGQFLIFPLWASFFLAWKEKIASEKWKYGLATGLMLLTLFFTENRATILGLLVSILVFVVLLNSLNRKTRIVAGVLGMLSLFVFIFFVAPSTRSIQSRLVLWKGIPALVSGNPVIGHGLETFKNVAQKTLSPEILLFEHLYDVPDRSHNEILDMFVMQGIFGVAVYLFSLGVLVWFTVKKNKLLEEPPLGASLFGLVAIFISSLFSFSLIPHFIILFTIISFLAINALRWQSAIIRPTVPISFFVGILAVLFVMSSFIVGKHLIGDTHFKKGMDAYYARDLTVSFEEIGKGLAQNPHQDDLYFTAGNVYFSVAEATKDPLILSAAAQFLEPAGAFSNHNFRYFIELARIRTAEKKFPEADKLYRSAVKLAPVNPVLWREWAMSHYYNKDYRATIEKMEHFLSLAPPYWRWSLELEKRSEEERRQYDLFMRLTPDFMDVFPPLARSYAELGNREKFDYYLEFVKDQKTRENIRGFLKS